MFGFSDLIFCRLLLCKRYCKINGHIHGINSFFMHFLTVISQYSGSNGSENYKIECRKRVLVNFLALK